MSEVATGKAKAPAYIDKTMAWSLRLDGYESMRSIRPTVVTFLLLI